MQVAHTFRADGSLHFGDSIIVQNLLTNGWLVCDTGDKITADDEAYAVTTTSQKVGACARTILHLLKANEKEQTDDLVRYGQDIRLKTNPFIF